MKSRTNLEVEKNWKDNVRINGNEKRSTRLDVYDKDTNTVYDYKFVRNGKLSEEKTGSFLLLQKQRLVKKAIVISESEKL